MCPIQKPSCEKPLPCKFLIDGKCGYFQRLKELKDLSNQIQADDMKQADSRLFRN